VCVTHLEGMETNKERELRQTGKNKLILFLFLFVDRATLLHYLDVCL